MRHDRQPTAHRRGQLHTVRQANANFRLDHQSIHDCFNRVLFLLAEFRDAIDFVDVPVDANADEPFAPNPLEHFVVVSPFVPDQRREHHDPRSFRHRQHVVDDLRRGLARDGFLAFAAMGIADPGVQEAKVVVDFRGGRDRRSGIAGARSLLNRNRRRQTLQVIRVRFGHLLEELAGIRRQRLHVPPLTLGIDRVERQRALPRPAQASDDHQFVSRDVQMDPFEVVLASPTNSYELLFLVQNLNSLILEPPRDSQGE